MYMYIGFIIRKKIALLSNVPENLGFFFFRDTLYKENTNFYVFETNQK